MRDQPLITIIVAVYNGASVLPACLDSIASQSLAKKELIIIDGGSTDGTLDILQARSAEIDYWVSEPDSGVYHAWNKAIAQAHGEWICFLGADDTFASNHVLSDMAAHLARAYPPVRIVYGRLAIVNDANEELYRIGQPWEEVRERFRSIMCIPHTGALHHRSLFAEHGGFDESFRIAGDYEFLLHELVQADALFVPDIVTVAMRQGGVSSNPANAWHSMLEIRRAQKMHGIVLPGWPWLSALARVLTRLVLWKLLGESRTRRLLDWGRRLSGKSAYWTRT